MRPLYRQWDRSIRMATLAVVGAILVGPAQGQDKRPLSVRALVPVGTYYVGQAIPLTVRVIATGDRPEVIAPRVEGAEVSAAGTTLQPVASGGIGDLVTETNLFAIRFRVVPGRPGPLVIPAIAVRQGGRTGRTGPIRLDVRALPIEGRPASFLGGIGPLAVSAEARPAAVRVGQEFEYRIRLVGPAARGSRRRPELVGLAALPIGATVEPLSAEEVAEPPSRAFRYRIRPTRAGEATLPPVAVSYFDPTSGRYLTRVTPGVPVRVVDVPEFDPESLDYGDRTTSRTGNTHWRGWAPMLVMGLLTLGLLAVGLASGRALSRRRADPGLLALRLARSLRDNLDADVAARRITDGLADYLARAIGRPPGALTPVEARLAIETVAGAGDLACRAGQLVADCDRARYAGRAATAEDLIREGRRVFGDLGRLGKVERGGIGGEKPREAFGTAP